MFLSGTVMTQVLNLHVQYTCRIGWDKIKEHCGCDRLQISFITPYKLLRFQTFEISGTLFFLVACTQLYKPLCRLVGRSVGRLVGPSVRRSVRRSVGRCSRRTRLMAIGLVSSLFHFFTYLILVSSLFLHHPKHSPYFSLLGSSFLLSIRPTLLTSLTYLSKPRSPYFLLIP